MKSNFEITPIDYEVIISALNHYYLYNLDRADQKEIVGTIEEGLCKKSAELSFDALDNLEQQQMEKENHGEIYNTLFSTWYT